MVLNFLFNQARKVKDVDPEEELLEAFRIFDKNNSGLISATELKHVVKQLGIEPNIMLGEPLTEEEAEQLIQEADTEKSGQIKYAEFVRLITTSYIN